MTAQTGNRKPSHRGRRVIWVVVAFLLALGLLNYFVGSGGVQFGPTSDRVALIRIEGPITASSQIVDRIEKYKDDSSIRALVLLVNSPGGGVAASQEIYHALLRFRDRGKSIVTSMESVAASGGYYVALASTKIFANAGTITGSIGVILQVGNFQGLMKKMGVDFEVIKSGEHKDLVSPFRRMTPKDREILQTLINDAYEQFVRAVSERRHLDVEAVRKVADGSIFSGQRAQGLGLIDEVGTLNDAVREAGRLAGLPGKPKVFEERPPGWFGRLLRNAWPGGWMVDRLPTMTGLQYLWTY
jgi:protease-4